MSRKHLSEEIVENQFNQAEIESESHILANIILMITWTPLQKLMWLAKRHLVKNKQKCLTCDLWMKLTKDKDYKLGYRWKCSCKSRLSVLHDSFFQHYQLQPEKILHAMYMWSTGDLNKKIIREVNISKNTVTTLTSDFREIAAVNLLERNDEMIGGINEDGTPKIVEVDESYFFRRKYNRGRLRDGQWVFGGIERDSKKCFMCVVPNRSQETLWELIRQNIQIGSKIISDGWAGYNVVAASELYEHEKIIHADNFVDPIDRSIHTQNIENLWSHAKRKLRDKFGCRSDELQNYLSEFLFKKIIQIIHVSIN